MMDQNKLRTLVFEKTGIRIDTMDPVFALVALNEAVLEDSVAQQAAVINAAADRLSMQADRLLDASDRYVQLLQRVEQLAGSGDGIHRSVASGIESTPTESRWQKHAASAAIALATAILTAMILWATGFRSPATVPKAASQEIWGEKIASRKMASAVGSASDPIAVPINARSNTFAIFL